MKSQLDVNGTIQEVDTHVGVAFPRGRYLYLRDVPKGIDLMPRRMSNGAAGYDLYALEDAVIRKGETVAIPTGIILELRPGWEAQIRSRSGLALNNGVFCLNAPGTIDADYRGEVKVIMTKIGGGDSGGHQVKMGDRIAQMVISRIPNIVWSSKNVEELTETERGDGGFGSTGS